MRCAQRPVTLRELLEQTGRSRLTRDEPGAEHSHQRARLVAASVSLRHRSTAAHVAVIPMLTQRVTLNVPVAVQQRLAVAALFRWTDVPAVVGGGLEAAIEAEDAVDAWEPAAIGSRSGSREVPEHTLHAGAVP